MWAIYKKEMRTFFTTPAGYIFLGIFLGAAGFLFGMANLQMQSSDVASYYQLLIFGYIVIIPLLTMKSFSEEKRAKTEQLLLTSPVSVTGIVLAKFLSCFTMYIGSVLLTWFYYIPLSMYGEPNLARFFGCMLAMAFIGACFIAIGLFISSLTENQFAAAFGTMAVLLLLVVIAMINSMIDSYAVRTVLSWISIYSRFYNFAYGIFDIAAAVYYISICAVFLFLTVRIYDKRRWS